MVRVIPNQEQPYEGLSFQAGVRHDRSDGFLLGAVIASLFLILMILAFYLGALWF